MATFESVLAGVMLWNFEESAGRSHHARRGFSNNLPLGCQVTHKRY